LRTKQDQEALKEGLIDGSIDCIATHHLPHNTDNKMVEFEYAQYGMTGLETAFAVVRSCVPQLDLQRLVDLFSAHPRKIFDLPAISVNKNARAALTLFLPEKKWSVEKFRSRSKNSPFAGKQLIGKPVGIINKDSLFLNE
jgi:dihydroorotase